MKDLINIIANNIRGSLYTTILGTLLLVAGLVSFFWESLDVDTAYSVLLILVGLVVACLKDPPNKNNKGNLKEREKVAFGIVILMIVLSSCATERRCSEKFGTSTSSDSVRVEIKEVVKDSIIYIESDTVKLFIENPCDSAGNLKPTIYKNSGANNTAESIVLISEKGIEVECLCKDEKIVIKKLRYEINQLKSHSKETKVVYKKKASWWPLIWKGLILFVVAYVLGVFKVHKLILKLFGI